MHQLLLMSKKWIRSVMWAKQIFWRLNEYWKNTLCLKMSYNVFQKLPQGVSAASAKQKICFLRKLIKIVRKQYAVETDIIQRHT